MKQKKTYKGYGTMEQCLRAFAKELLRQKTTDCVIAVGPICWNIDKGSDQRFFYFLAAVGKLGTPAFDLNMFRTSSHEMTEKARANLLLELIRNHRPLVINDFDDEIPFAQFLAATFPGERSKKLRDDIEAELRP